MKWAERKRCAASPAAHHLGGKKFLVHIAGCICLQKLAKVGDTLMELAKDNVRSISPEQFRVSFLYSSQLIRVTENKLTGLERPFLWICPRNPASFNGRMADSVLEPKGLFLIG